MIIALLFCPAPQNARDALKVLLVSRAVDEVALGTGSAAIRETRVWSTLGKRGLRPAQRVRHSRRH